MSSRIKLKDKCNLFIKKISCKKICLLKKYGYYNLRPHSQNIHQLFLQVDIARVQDHHLKMVDLEIIQAHK
jgi:hypothetical protein